MGASGSGKTSLMNLLSDRIMKRRDNIIEGKVMVNDNQILDMTLFAKIGAYVM